MGLHDFKKRFSSHPNAKNGPSSIEKKEAPSELEAPSPTVPMDSRRRLQVQQVRSEKQRVGVMAPRVPTTHAIHAMQDGSSGKSRDDGLSAKEFMRHEPLPTSPSSYGSSISGSGEPLFQDNVATRPVPQEFKPHIRTRDLEIPSTARQDSMRQESLRQNSQRPTMRMELDPEEIESIQLRRSRAKSPVVVAPSREGTPVSHRVMRTNQEDEHPETRQAESSYADTRPNSGVSSSPSTTKYMSSRQSNPSVISLETNATSVDLNGLPPLQARSALPDGERLEPLMEDDPSSFDLVLPIQGEGGRLFQLEDRSEMMFSREHLLEIFKDTPLLLQFTNFLNTKRPKSVPLLVYYLDALKALRALKYANAIAEALSPMESYEFSAQPADPTVNTILEQRANEAFDTLVKDDLPAFITYTFIRVVSLSISRRITGTLPVHLREASEGLAEVFCLTDPNRADNPIIFSSEEFHRTTQYGVSYAIGRNCRFLQGPRTNKYSVERLGRAIREQREVSEVFLNYRRDGSPFMNLLMCAPLLDSKGKTRYFIGAQVDVSGLCKEGSELPGLQRLIAKQEEERSRKNGKSESRSEDEEEESDEFQELAEMFNEMELNTVKRFGGKIHKEQLDEDGEGRRGDRPRLLIKENSDGEPSPTFARAALSVRNGKLEGVYQNYLLVRPYPSLRILFCSPSLRVPGILQSPFLDRIGGSNHVRETLIGALADGRGVTAKVRWISGRSSDEQGRPRWIHCTPLLGQNGAIGVWMVVLVEDQDSVPRRKFRIPPPVESTRGRKVGESDLDLFENEPFGMVMSRNRRQDNQDAEYRGGNGMRPKTGNSCGQESLESFTIGAA